MHRPASRWMTCPILVLLACARLQSSFGQGEKAYDFSAPATVEQAAAVIDFTTFPLVDPLKLPSQLVVASQTYVAKGKIAVIAAKLQKQFTANGWEEQDGTILSDDYANAIFQKQQFAISMSVLRGNTSDQAAVVLTNHGNVELARLPVPQGVKSIFASPIRVQWGSEKSVADTTEECRRLLQAAGWQPFGNTTASFFVKQNAVRLQVSVNVAPTRRGKSAIQITSEQLSVDLPAPTDAERLRYTDSVGNLMFDSPQSQAELFKFYTDALVERGWTPTSDRPRKIDIRDHLIFRSPQEEMIDLEIYEVDGKTRASVKYDTAKEVAARSKQQDERAGQIRSKQEAEHERRKSPVRITISAPKNARLEDQDQRQVTFVTKSGIARSAVLAWLEVQKKAGWKSTTIVDRNEAGNFDLEKDDVELDISFVDPGLIPGTITIGVSGERKLEIVAPVR